MRKQVRILAKKEERQEALKQMTNFQVRRIESAQQQGGNACRNKWLFGRIKDYKRKNNVKYRWTSNGKIMLKVNEMSATKAFTMHEEFEDYLDQISNS